MKFCTPLFIVLSGLAAWSIDASAQTLIVAPGSVWKYLDNGSNQGTAWRAMAFDDGAWSAGAAELGYGDTADGRPERTQIGYGTNASSKYITYYFRYGFTVSNPGSFTNLVLGLLRDDGALVYLNGAEIYRNNMGTNAVTYSTTAATNVSGADEATFYTTNLNPSLLNAGTNLLAVEVHQNNGGSTDISFDLFLAGFTTTPLTNALVFQVATNGNDNWNGASPVPVGGDGPLATLERARDFVRFYAQNNYLPPGGLVVEVAGGVYQLPHSLDLTAADSGQPQAPIIWRARPGEEVRITGGQRLNGFTLATDPALLARLDASARGKVWQTDLRAQGITNFGVMQGATGWAQSDPGLELFFNDRPMTLARWPNEGYVKIVKALGPTPVDIRGTKGTVEGIFSFEGDRSIRWMGETDIMVHGFWFWDWADQRHKVLSLDTVSNIITVATPYHTYGYRDGQWFYAYNLLCELDQPGEWYLDRQSGILYFWPPTPIEQGTAVVSLSQNLITLTSASFLTFQGFTFEGSQNTGISISGGMSNCVKACTIRNIGKTGVSIVNSPGSGVSGCDIYFTGDGGVTLSGGDRPTLTPAGLFGDNNHIHHYARWNPVYKPAISLSGVGNRATHNLIHDAPHEGIAFGGNDHLIEFNEFHNVVNESNDAGVIYAGRDWTMRGHIIRYNYFHHIYGFQRRGCNCVYLDDQFSSALVYGNVFYDVPTAMLIGGGRENFMMNNVFVNCRRAISIDARGLGWAASGFAGLSNKLVSLPYQGPPWSVRYPELTNILNENPMAPTNNVVTQNISWGGAWTSIESAAQPGVILSNNLVGIDPLLVDSNHLNFQLQNNSPAFALGFQRIPLEQIGPQTTNEHARWMPTVTLIGPLTSSVYGTPTNLTLEAVLSDPDHLAEKVQFFVGNALLGEVTSLPYRFLWHDTPAGYYALTAWPVASNAPIVVPSPVRIQVNDALVPVGSEWKYLDNGSNQGTEWCAMDFNDSAWASGFAELGYGDTADGRPERTQISYGPNSNNKYITYYFRRAFNVADPGAYTNLVLGLLRDDGAVVYLNGAEIFRSNMGTGVVSYTTLAATNITGADETIIWTTNLNPSLLNAGTNWLAVEVHQSGPTSADVSFDLYLHGMTATAAPILEARRSGNALLLSWPLSASDFVLRTTPSLPAMQWDTPSSSTSVTSNRVSVILNADAGARFFRLAKP